MISQEAFDQMKEDMCCTTADEVQLHLWYPRSVDRPRAIRIGLMDVRCADDIQIKYDYERNGWVISKQSRPYDDFVEAAFVPGRRDK